MTREECLKSLVKFMGEYADEYGNIKEADVAIMTKKEGLIDFKSVNYSLELPSSANSFTITLTIKVGEDVKKYGGKIENPDLLECCLYSYKLCPSNIDYFYKTSAYKIMTELGIPEFGQEDKTEIIAVGHDGKPDFPYILEESHVFGNN